MNLLDDVIKFALRQRYPEVTPPVMKFDKKKGKEYLAKSESPEAKAVKKFRDATQRRINAGDYDPYFNIADRFTVDRYKYPVASQPNQTLSVLPANKIEILDTLESEEPLLLKYKVRVTEERPDE